MDNKQQKRATKKKKEKEQGAKGRTREEKKKNKRAKESRVAREPGGDSSERMNEWPLSTCEERTAPLPRTDRSWWRRGMAARSSTEPQPLQTHQAASVPWFCAWGWQMHGSRYPGCGWCGCGWCGCGAHGGGACPLGWSRSSARGSARAARRRISAGEMSWQCRLGRNGKRETKGKGKGKGKGEKNVSHRHPRVFCAGRFPFLRFFEEEMESGIENGREGKGRERKGRKRTYLHSLRG